MKYSMYWFTLKTFVFNLFVAHGVDESHHLNELWKSKQLNVWKMIMITFTSSRNHI